MMDTFLLGSVLRWLSAFVRVVGGFGGKGQGL